MPHRPWASSSRGDGRCCPTLRLLFKLEETIAYSLAYMPYVRNTVACGEAELTNNHAKRAVKPFVTGRKNWLFSNSSRAPRPRTASTPLRSPPTRMGSHPNATSSGCSRSSRWRATAPSSPSSTASFRGRRRSPTGTGCRAPVPTSSWTLGRSPSQTPTQVSYAWTSNPFEFRTKPTMVTFRSGHCRLYQ